MKKTLYHVSFRPVRELIPRVPRYRAAGENRELKRICFSDSILLALSAMPQGVLCLIGARAAGIVPMLYIYEFHPGDNPGIRVLHDWEIANYVPDAMTTHEHWVLDSPQVLQKTVCPVEDFTFRLTSGEGVEPFRRGYLLETLRLGAPVKRPARTMRNQLRRIDAEQWKGIEKIDTKTILAYLGAKTERGGSHGI